MAYFSKRFRNVECQVDSGKVNIKSDILMFHVNWIGKNERGNHTHALNLVKLNTMIKINN